MQTKPVSPQRAAAPTKTLHLVKSRLNTPDPSPSERKSIVARIVLHDVDFCKVATAVGIDYNRLARILVQGMSDDFSERLKAEYQRGVRVGYQRRNGPVQIERRGMGVAA